MELLSPTDELPSCPCLGQFGVPVELGGGHVLISQSKHEVQLLIQCQEARRECRRQLQAVGKAWAWL